MEKPSLEFEIVDFDDEGKPIPSITEESIIRLCKFYYGATFTGLSINKTNFESWKKWYLSQYDVSPENIEWLKEAYQCALYIWKHYE